MNLHINKSIVYSPWFQRREMGLDQIYKLSDISFQQVYDRTYIKSIDLPLEFPGENITFLSARVFSGG